MKKILSVILTIALILSTTIVFAFSDTDSVKWAQDAIDRLSQQKVINGYEDGTFRPEKNVTRAEFAKMLCLAFDCSGKTDSPVYNIDHWAKDYIIHTADVVYTAGESYEPDKNATRAEIAYALSKVLSLEGDDFDAESKFSDWDSVDDAIADGVASAVAAGLIEGYENGEIRGANPVTRAEAAVLIVRAMDYEAPESDRDEEEIPPVEIPPEEPDAEEEPDTENKNDIFAGLDHLYTLYPLEDILLVTSVTTVLSEDSSYPACRLTYKIAGGNKEEYTSVIDDEDIVVSGVKTSLADIKPGDAFIVDMVFLTQIKNIYVLASFGDEPAMCVPVSRKLGAYGSDAEYEFLGGKVVERKINTNSVSLTIENSGGTERVNIPRSVDADVYKGGRRSEWADGSASTFHEGDYVYIRYSDGKATELIGVDVD